LIAFIGGMAINAVSVEKMVAYRMDVNREVKMES